MADETVDLDYQISEDLDEFSKKYINVVKSEFKRDFDENNTIRYKAIDHENNEVSITIKNLI